MCNLLAKYFDGHPLCGICKNYRGSPSPSNLKVATEMLPHRIHVLLYSIRIYKAKVNVYNVRFGRK